MMIRQLGRIERSREQASRANTLNIVAYSKVRGNLEPRLLEKALALTAERHPLLAAHIIQQGRQLYFAKRPFQVPPLEVIHLEQDSDWFEWYQQALNHPLRSEHCLSRFWLLTTPEAQLSYLIITTHHAISDGLSSAPLHEEIVNCCNRLQAAGFPETVVDGFQDYPGQPAPLPLLPPIEAMFPEEFRGWRGWVKCGQLLLELLRNRRKKTLSHLPLSTKAAVELRKTRVVQHRLGPQETLGLLQACTERKVTLNSAVTAAMLIAVARQICGDSEDAITLATQLAVDLRRYLVPPGEQKATKANRISPQWLTDCAGGVLQAHDVGPKSDLWRLAGQIRDRLRQNFRDRDMLTYSWLFGALAMLGPQKDPGPSSIAVSSSNISQTQWTVEPSPCGQVLFEVEDYSGAPSVSLYAGTFMILVSQFGDELTLNFLFSEPALSETVMQGLIQETLTQLRQQVPVNL